MYISPVPAFPIPSPGYASMVISQKNPLQPLSSLYTSTSSDDTTPPIPETAQFLMPPSRRKNEIKTKYAPSDPVSTSSVENVLLCNITQEYCDQHFFDPDNPPQVTDIVFDNDIITSFAVKFDDHFTRFSLVEHLQRKGGYGYVNFYLANSPYPTFLLIKNTNSPTDPEGLIANRIRRDKKLSECGTIKARYDDAILGGSSYQQYIYLQFMDTDLSYFRLRDHLLSEEKVKEIMISVFQQIHCLLEYSNGTLAYTDLKPHNVLAKLDLNKQPQKVRLGDLGSCGEYNGLCVVTYKYHAGIYDHRLFTSAYRTKINEKVLCIPKNSRVRAIRYFIGVMALELLGYDITSLKLKDANVRKKYQNELLGSLGPFFNNMLWYQDKNLEKSTIGSKNLTPTTLKLN